MMVAEAATASFAPIAIDADEELATPTMDLDEDDHGPPMELEGLL
jgi:hypothetical protein